MGMAASVDASSIRGVSDLISAHMTQSTTMDVNLANHISNEGEFFNLNERDLWSPCIFIYFPRFPRGVIWTLPESRWF